MIFSKIASHKSSVSLRACPSFHQVAEFISLLLKCRLAVLWLALTNRLHQKSHCPLDPALVRLTNCHFHFLGTLRYPVTKSDQSAWDKGHMQSSSIRCEIYTERDRERHGGRERRGKGMREEGKRRRKERERKVKQPSAMLATSDKALDIWIKPSCILRTLTDLVNQHHVREKGAHPSQLLPRVQNQEQ